MCLNSYGDIAQKYWREIPKHYKNVAIDEYIIMPNHVHGIIIIQKNNVGTEHCSVPTDKIYKYILEDRDRYGLLSKIIKSYKEAVIKNINFTRNNSFSWQRSFYDHIIRNENSLLTLRKYIRYNPIKWRWDCYNYKT